MEAKIGVVFKSSFRRMEELFFEEKLGAVNKSFDYSIQQGKDNDILRNIKGEVL